MKKNFRHFFQFQGFSVNGRGTLAPKNLIFLNVIGQRNGLSHLDKLQANLMYGCVGQWETACGVSPGHCGDFGYVHKDCTCKCLPGKSGANCEVTEKTLDGEMKSSSPHLIRIYQLLVQTRYVDFE